MGDSKAWHCSQEISGPTSLEARMGPAMSRGEKMQTMVMHHPDDSRKGLRFRASICQTILRRLD